MNQVNQFTLIKKWSRFLNSEQKHGDYPRQTLTLILTFLTLILQ